MDFRFFGITISPPPRPQLSPKFAYGDDKYRLERWLNSFSGHWILYPEFSRDSRLHYHGVVRVDDKIKLHKTKFRICRQIGFVKLDYLKTKVDHLRWLIYCQKEYVDTSRILTLFYRHRIKRRDPVYVDCRKNPSILDYFAEKSIPNKNLTKGRIKRESKERSSLLSL